MIVICKTCLKPFNTTPWKARNGRKYCSTSCRSKATVHILHARRGDSFKEAGRNQLRKIHQMIRLDETKSPLWKGDNAVYGAIHKWLRRHWGSPSECEVCGTTDPSKLYEWANLTKKYLRDRSDFKRMCISCHRKYDRKSPRRCDVIKAA